MTAATEESHHLTTNMAAAPTASNLTTPTRKTSRQAFRPLVYVTRRIPQRGMDVLLRACDVKQWDSEQAVPRGEFLHSVDDVEGILCMASDTINADVLDAAGPQLRIVATMAQSTSHIDVDECQKRGIQVITCPDQPTEILAELTVALVLLTFKESQTEEEMLISAELQPPDLISSSPNEVGSSWTNTRPRNIRRLSQEQLAFQWTNGKPANTNCLTWKNIVKKTFGIYGMTKLGLSVAKILKTLDVCEVLIADKDADLDNSQVTLTSTDCNFVSFDELLQRSDVICVCGSVGELSDGVFNQEAFIKMKNQAILIASQSDEKAIDYVDLYTALRDGQLRAAGLNDCNQEPVPFKTLLLGLKNCTFLPQTEESVYDMRHKVSVLIAKNLTDSLTKNGKK